MKRILKAMILPTTVVIGLIASAWLFNLMVEAIGGDVLSAILFFLLIWSIVFAIQLFD